MNAPTQGARAAELGARLREVRKATERLCAPLAVEDYVVQSMPDASPTKWHLAHTTWFFEAFLLKRFLRGYRVFDERFEYCFNSYYESVGPRQPRAKRGLLTRPSAEEVRAYRAYVDAALGRLFEGDLPQEAAELIELGINHEQQHQELLLTDTLSLFAAEPLKPAYRQASPGVVVREALPLDFVAFDGGIYDIGHDGGGFAYDNEGPLYWEDAEGGYMQMSLLGFRPVDLAAPVTHVSYYEADAFARWAGYRLPTEFEWEVAAASVPVTGRTLGEDCLRPMPAKPGTGLLQMFGDVWEWTASAYLPYPGFKTAPGAVGEYNGKFMANQFVLRGGSCATPDCHVRRTYRNFFYPHQRWQFTGLRLAADA